MMFFGKQVICDPNVPQNWRIGPHQAILRPDEMPQLIKCAAGCPDEAATEWLNGFLSECAQYDTRAS